VALTTVGISVQTNTAQGVSASIAPSAYCVSMCVFLLPIWQDALRDRDCPCSGASDLDRRSREWAATYSANDLTIVERDIGRLAKHTYDMGGGGDPLSLALYVPPWEDLHELSREELRLTNLVTTDMVAQPGSPNAAVIELTPKPAQARFASSAVTTETKPEPANQDG
jgi:hypothetical protein